MTTGKVRTVLGDIDPSSLGVTLTHEHLLICLVPPGGVGGAARGAQEAAHDPRAGQPIMLENAGWVRRHWSSHEDNLRLDDEALAIDEIRRFQDAGGGAVVDATNPDLGRDAEALERIARATGVRIVMGTGNYVDAFHPPEMAERTEDEITQTIVRDVTEGCDGTGIKAGIIGEIGCSAPMTANERKALRAGARAQRLTGAALLIHPGREVTGPLQAMEVVIDAGGDSERTIMSHIDRTLFEPADVLALAKTGCYVEFDLFGQESSYYPLSPIDMPNDAGRIDHLMRLIAEGFEEKLLIAQDICRKTSLATYGGEGYAHILENVLPVMKRKEMTKAQIDSILVRNPARVLALAPPEAASEP